MDASDVITLRASGRRPAAIATGGVLGVLTYRLISGGFPRHTGRVAAAALVGAAVVYPVARSRRPADTGVAAREWSAVAVTTAVLAGTLVVPERSGRLLAATGWLLHPGFDRLHPRGPTSRLPDWYPSMCAGYDLAMAALLYAADRTREPTDGAAAAEVR